MGNTQGMGEECAMEIETITMYTSQTNAVTDIIRRDGVSYVKQRYIEKKYQDTAWIFNEAYHFFNRYAAQIVEKPVQAESPVWVFHDPKWAGADQNSSQLKLEIPVNEIILFDLRKWNRILNLELIGTKEEEERFTAELQKWGVRDASDVFSGSFYPILKNKIKKSWAKLFDDSEDILQELKEGNFRKFGNGDTDYIQGAVWRLRKDWVL